MNVVNNLLDISNLQADDYTPIDISIIIGSDLPISHFSVEISGYYNFSLIDNDISAITAATNLQI